MSPEGFLPEHLQGFYIGIRKTRNWFRYPNFYYLFVFKVFRHEERERHNFFLCWHFHLNPTTCSTPAANYWSGLGELRISTSFMHLTNPCTKRKVLSLTKPKGKIYKTKYDNIKKISLRNYITCVPKCRRAYGITVFAYAHLHPLLNWPYVEKSSIKTVILKAG